MYFVVFVFPGAAHVHVHPVDERAEAAPNREAASILPGAGRIGDESVFLDPQRRRLILDNFDRNVRHTGSEPAERSVIGVRLRTSAA